MVSPVGSPGVTPAKKVEPKKEEAKTENQSPQKPVEPPKAGNAGEAKREERTAFTGALDPKATFEVSQSLQKKKSGNAGEAPNGSDSTAPDAESLHDALKNMKPPGGEDETKKPDDNKGGGNTVSGGAKPAGGEEDKPKDPPKMTTRRALDILMDDGNKGLDKLDVAKDKIKKGKDNPDGDHKVSTEDLDLALGKEGYLTKEEAEAAKHLRDSGAWDEINGKDSKATYDEITDYRNNRTSPDNPDERRPEGNGSSDVKSDGKIDSFEQGDTGDCWWLASINAVNQTEEGKKDIKDAIKQNDDGSFSVKFKGDKNGKTYTVTEEMVRKNKNSKGDDDVKILEEAARQYFNDNPTRNGGEGDGKSPITDGGFHADGVSLLTGKEGHGASANGFDALDSARDKAEKKDKISNDGKISSKDLKAAVENDGIVNDEEKEAAKTLLNSDAWDDINGKDDKATVEEILDYAKKHGDTDAAKAIDVLTGNKQKDKAKMIEDFKKDPGKSTMTFSAPGKDNAETGASKNGHAFTVLRIEGDTVIYANPWDSDKERKMSVDDLMNADQLYYTAL